MYGECPDLRRNLFGVTIVSLAPGTLCVSSDYHPLDQSVIPSVCNVAGMIDQLDLFIQLPFITSSQWMKLNASPNSTLYSLTENLVCY